MTVNTTLPAGITIAASTNPFCEGNSVSYWANPANGGLSPSFQWKVNGINTGTNSPAFSYSPLAGDSICCVMTSNLSCVTTNPAYSNKIIMAAAVRPTVSFVACNDVITTVNAQPFRLKGGTPLGGVYSGPGVNSVTGIFTPSVAGTGIKTIKYSYTNVATCSDEKSTTITVQPAPSFTCGNVLTDVRDGKQYKTFALPNGRCWMAENLEYGVTIDEFLPQTDNCLAERYVRTSYFVPGTSGSVLNSKFDCSTVQMFNEISQISNLKFDVSNLISEISDLRFEVRNGALYQWDELMQYSQQPGIQGLCPPGWHVPTASEWDDLLSFYNGPGQAGGPFKDTLISTGFHSIQQGFLYQNNTWAFTSGLQAGSMYWSSTASGTDRAVARGLNDYNLSVSRYSSLRSNGFGVRCCKD